MPFSPHSDRTGCSNRGTAGITPLLFRHKTRAADTTTPAREQPSCSVSQGRGVVVTIKPSRTRPPQRSQGVARRYHRLANEMLSATLRVSTRTHGIECLAHTPDTVAYTQVAHDYDNSQPDRVLRSAFDGFLVYQSERRVELVGYTSGPLLIRRAG